MKPKLTAFAASLTLTTLAIISPLSNADTSSLPSVATQGAVSYVTGGVGEDEADAFKRAAAEYPLELLFAQRAQPKDMYLADVKVIIRDRSGRPVLETTAEGPFLLARIPAGTYQVEAEFGGLKKRQAVEIRPGKHQRAVFVWAQTDERDEATSVTPVGSMIAPES